MPLWTYNLSRICKLDNVCKPHQKCIRGEAKAHEEEENPNEEED
jgi:hypothetical protein